jgi:signal peptidase I
MAPFPLFLAPTSPPYYNVPTPKIFMDQTQQTVPPAQKKSSFLKELVSFALIVIFIVLPIRLFVAQPFVVVGTSMQPTFESNDYLIVDELSYHFEAPKRGDVVVFKYDNTYGTSDTSDAQGGEDGSKFFIKRIIGLPGETIDIHNGKVTIINKANPNGFVLNEPYEKEAPTNSMTVTLDNSHYFVMGDNREVSFDSRSWGPMPASKLVGKVFLRLLPFSKLGLAPGSYAGDYTNEKR